MPLGTPLVFIGNSGCGKDTSISLLVDHIYTQGHSVKVLKRYITRLPDNSEKNHFISKDKFEILSGEEFFGFQWEAYGNYYGYAKVDLSLALQSTDFLILNVSRTVIKEVLTIFPDSIILHVACNDELAKARIESRSRDKFMDERIARFNSLSTFPQNTITIENNNSLESLKFSIAQSFIQILNSSQQNKPSQVIVHDHLGVNHSHCCQQLT